jgi:hypothetical protein
MHGSIGVSFITITSNPIAAIVVSNFATIVSISTKV